MSRWEKTFAMCTAPRVTLLAVAAVVSMFVLVLHAELPLVSALEVAASLQKAAPARPLPARCDLAALSMQRRPLQSFDGRLSGYSVEDTGAILCAMEMNDGAGKQAYLDRHFPLDMVFPCFYGPALAALFLFLLQSQTWHSGGFKYLALAPLVAALLDISENLAVRSLVIAGLPPNPDWVRVASALTTSKNALAYPSMIITLALLVWYLVTRLGSSDARA